MTLAETDRLWFEAHPARGYRCRHQTDEKKGEDRAVLSGPAYGLVIIRRCDGLTVDMWSSNPSLYIDSDDEDLSDWLAHYQGQAA